MEGEFPAAESCQVAKPSCASGKVDLALCPLQDKSRLIALHDVNQGCVYLLGFTGLVPRGMCSPGQLSPAPHVEETERVWVLLGLHQTGVCVLRDRGVASRHSLRTAGLLGEIA